MSISLDFSTWPELRPLAAQARVVRAAAGGRPLLLAGARARDLLLLPFPDIPVARATLDADFVIAVETWDDYEAVRATLIRDHGFSGVPGKHHRLRASGDAIDLIPFGGIEDAQRQIVWPPERDMMMTLTGFREALLSAIRIRLPDGVEIDCVSLPGLVMTKLVAWTERGPEKRRDDAGDIGLMMRNYLAAGNRERLYDQHADLLDDEAFDDQRAGARILGRDLGTLLRLCPEHENATRARLVEILDHETDTEGPLRLATDMNFPSGNAVELLVALKNGMIEN